MNHRIGFEFFIRFPLHLGYYACKSRAEPHVRAGSDQRSFCRLHKSGKPSCLYIAFPLLWYQPLSSCFKDKATGTFSRHLWYFFAFLSIIIHW